MADEAVFDVALPKVPPNATLVYALQIETGTAHKNRALVGKPPAMKG
ncbi:hypothetical protein QZQ97_19460 [Serratia sp. root2]|nr:hypothetical protein [Serratia sp. root2]MDT3253101.1 hypothetical protein [Serratia sp. root2]